MYNGQRARHTQTDYFPWPAAKEKKEKRTGRSRPLSHIISRPYTYSIIITERGEYITCPRPPLSSVLYRDFSLFISDANAFLFSHIFFEKNHCVVSIYTSFLPFFVIRFSTTSSFLHFLFCYNKREKIRRVRLWEFDIPPFVHHVCRYKLITYRYRLRERDFLVILYRPSISMCGWAFFRCNMDGYVSRASRVIRRPRLS